MNLPELTVVVTTFRRSERLRKCLQSLVDAGVERVVVTGSGYTSKDGKVIEEFKPKFPDFSVTYIEHDLGNNECWLRGVTRARTRFVNVLHDDDWHDREFGEAYAKEIYPQLARGVGFATWRGKVVSDIGEVDDSVGCLLGSTRVAGSGVVTKTILGPVTSPSPVISVFRRDIVIRALREAEMCLHDRKHFSRHNMLVGNDLLMMLRSAEACDSWFFLDKILTNHGGHFGSETAKHQTPKKLKKLIGMYDATRDHFRRNRAGAIKLPPKFFHVYTQYEPKEKEAKRRIAFAKASWDSHLYSNGQVYPVPYAEGRGRTSRKEIGDVRDLPFIRDMLDAAAEFALEDDVIFLSNDDTVFVEGFVERMLAEINQGANSFYAWRRNFFHKLKWPMKDIRQGFEDGGVDLIAFKKETWLKYRTVLPDFICGAECWDFAARVLIPEINGGRPGLHDGIYHEYHNPVWRQPKIRTTNPAQVYCRNLARNFFIRRSDFANAAEVKESGWKDGH